MLTLGLIALTLQAWTSQALANPFILSACAAAASVPLAPAQFYLQLSVPKTQN